MNNAAQWEDWVALILEIGGIVVLTLGAFQWFSAKRINDLKRTARAKRMVFWALVVMLVTILAWIQLNFTVSDQGMGNVRT
jgi:uncharacterized membrane protein YidH (DUF202 family)